MKQTDVDELKMRFWEEASKLGDFTQLSKTALANGYCDADERAKEARRLNQSDLSFENKRSQYFAALMLKYWSKIYKWMNDSASLRLEPIEFVNWLSKSLYNAFYYRTWRYPYKAVVKHGNFIEWELDAEGNKIPNKYFYQLDPNAPDKIINKCCWSMRGEQYQYYNKDKRKAGVQTYSLEAMTEATGDEAFSNNNNYTLDRTRVEGVYDVVQSFLRRNKVIEALIVDGIANYDAYKEVKTKIQVKNTDDEGVETITEKKVNSEIFDSRKLVKHLNLINQDFMNDFCKHYEVPLSQSKGMFNFLKGINNTKLYKFIGATLLEMRKDNDLIETLSM